jgi:hypothetical protein
MAERRQEAGAAVMDAAVDAFVADPGSWADPALLVKLLALGLSAETARYLLTSPRLGARVSRYLADRLGHGDSSALDPTDLALACADVGVLRDVALRAGAVWHARRVCALVRGADIAELCDHLGDAVRHTALRHTALAPGDDGGVNDAHSLVADIVRDGGGCMSAWITALPDWASARVRLKWPDESPSPAGARRQAAVVIVRTLAIETLTA